MNSISTSPKQDINPISTSLKEDINPISAMEDPLPINPISPKEDINLEESNVVADIYLEARDVYMEDVEATDNVIEAAGIMEDADNVVAGNVIEAAGDVTVDVGDMAAGTVTAEIAGNVTDITEIPCIVASVGNILNITEIFSSFYKENPFGVRPHIEILESGMVLLGAAFGATIVLICLNVYTFWAARRGHDYKFLVPFLLASIVVLFIFYYLIIKVRIHENPLFAFSYVFECYFN